VVDKTTFKTRLFFIRTEFFTLTMSGPARCAINIHRAIHNVEISWWQHQKMLLENYILGIIWMLDTTIGIISIF
jgi:hypothetical protein